MALRPGLFYPLWRPLFLVTLLALAGCKIEVVVPQNAIVLTESGSFTCPGGETCVLDAIDTSFNETFIAVPASGYHFAGWERGQGALCGGMTAPCRLRVGDFADTEKVSAILQSDISVGLAPRIVPARDFNFSGVDATLQYFLLGRSLDGFAVTIVHRDFGELFKRAYGDFELDRVVQLRSASKLASTTLMLALEHHGGVDFNTRTPIASYLPFEGVYGDRTSEQLLSQTSGIPGSAFWISYATHMCQYDPDANFDSCGKAIYQSELPDTQPAGTSYSYGGSQWQLAGLVARHASGRHWGELFRKLVANPCGMETFQYGNPASALWDGNPDNLSGKDNPNIEAGAVSDLEDYGKLIALLLNDGWCDNRRVLAPGAVEFMRRDRSRPAIPPEGNLDGGYAMGAFINGVARTNENPVHVTPGALGTIVWIDSTLDYGVVFMAETENFSAYPDLREFTENVLIPQIRQAVEASLE